MHWRYDKECVNFNICILVLKLLLLSPFKLGVHPAFDRRKCTFLDFILAVTTYSAGADCAPVAYFLVCITTLLRVCHIREKRSPWIDDKKLCGSDFCR